MKLNVNYIDNSLNIDDSNVLCVEIENKKYFYRFIKDLNNISNGIGNEDIIIYEDDKEINLTNKIKILVNYFDLELNNKKLSNDIVKYINDNIDEEIKFKLSQEILKIIKIYKNVLNEFDMPLVIDENLSVESITKNLKISLDEKSELLENLLLLIDLERTIKCNELLVFVNLKQYLSKEELNELYKYSLYNKIKIMLVDSQCYGVTLNYEKKLIIDESLEEFVL